jgi:hypothetical protein
MLTAAYMAQQRLIATTFSRDLLLLLRAVFSTVDPGQSWPATRMAVTSLIRERRRSSADAAARYFVDLRRLEVPQRVPAAQAQPSPVQLLGSEPTTVPGTWADLERIAPVTPEDIAVLDEDRVEANLNATGIASYQRAIRAAKSPEQARDIMTTTMTGASTRLVLEGGRQVIHDAVMGDEHAIGWARITDPDPCAFCAMLASRGAVYHTRMTAGGKANKRFVGDGMFKFHNNDACLAKPIFDPDDEALKVADELYDRWLRVTRASPHMKMIDSWTLYWNDLDPADKPIVQLDQAA